MSIVRRPRRSATPVRRRFRTTCRSTSRPARSGTSHWAPQATHASYRRAAFHFVEPRWLRSAFYLKHPGNMRAATRAPKGQSRTLAILTTVESRTEPSARWADRGSDPRTSNLAAGRCRFEKCSEKRSTALSTTNSTKEARRPDRGGPGAFGSRPPARLGFDTVDDHVDRRVDSFSIEITAASARRTSTSGPARRIPRGRYRETVPRPAVEGAMDRRFEPSPRTSTGARPPSCWVAEEGATARASTSEPL